MNIINGPLLCITDSMMLFGNMVNKIRCRYCDTSNNNDTNEYIYEQLCGLFEAAQNM